MLLTNGSSGETEVTRSGTLLISHGHCHAVGERGRDRHRDRDRDSGTERERERERAQGSTVLLCPRGFSSLSAAIQSLIPSPLRKISEITAHYASRSLPRFCSCAHRPSGAEEPPADLGTRAREERYRSHGTAARSARCSASFRRTGLLFASSARSLVSESILAFRLRTSALFVSAAHTHGRSQLSFVCRHTHVQTWVHTDCLYRRM